LQEKHKTKASALDDYCPPCSNAEGARNISCALVAARRLSLESMLRTVSPYPLTQWCLVLEILFE
jgi:hypothetical protein